MKPIYIGRIPLVNILGLLLVIPAALLEWTMKGAQFVADSCEWLGERLCDFAKKHCLPFKEKDK